MWSVSWKTYSTNFPVSQIQFFIPKWVEMLPMDHELKQQLLTQIREKMKNLFHIRDITKESVQLSGPYVQDSLLEEDRTFGWNGEGQSPDQR